MSDELSSQNPYESPNVAKDAPARSDDHPSVQVIRKSLLYRTLAITGRCQCVVDYFYGGIVRVNNTQMYRASNNLLEQAWISHVNFEIPTLHGPVTAHLEAKSILLIFIDVIRLSIDGKWVYVEGIWRS